MQAVFKFRMMLIMAASFVPICAFSATNEGAIAINKPNKSIAFLLHNPKNVDALGLRCTSETDTLDVFECSANQIMVSKEANDSLNKQNKEAILVELGKEDFGKFKADCLERKDETASIAKENSYKQAAHSADKKFNDDICGCEKMECVSKKMMEYSAKKNTCRIDATQFSFTAKRQTENRWVSTHGPGGLCGIVLTHILEYQKDSDSWVFTQKRTATVLDNEKLCGGLENTSQHFSHYKYLQSALMGCDYIDQIMP